MTNPTTNGHTPATDPVEVPALNAALDEAVRRAIGTQIAAQAKDIAQEALDAALTPEVLGGMRETAAQAAVEALAAPQPDETPEPPKELHFKSVEAFVEKYIAPIYAREVTKPGLEGQIRWCPLWHEHPEAVGRFRAMWLAWEHLRHGADVQMSQWWRDHADHHMPYLFDPHGPFKYCSVHKGHSDKLQPLPLTPVPADSTQEGYEVLESGLVVVREARHTRAVVVETFP